jgi:hypothetical protein
MKMQTIRNVGFLVLAGSAVYVSGCGSGTKADAPVPTVAPQGGTLKETGQKLLASVVIEPGHRVDFYELVDGQTVVGETGLAYQARVVDKVAGAKGLAGIHRAIRPTSEVPAALVAADEHYAASVRTVPAAKRDVPPPPADSPTTGAGPKFYNAGEQSWFKSTQCVDSGIRSLVWSAVDGGCIQGYSWAHSGWILGGVVSSQSMVGSEAAQAGTLTVYKWVNGSAQQVLNVLVQPGTYYWTLYPGGSGDDGYVDGSFQYYQFDLDNAGGNTLVSEALEACGENGERSCATTCGGHPCDGAHTNGCNVDGTQNGTCYCVGC